MAVTKGRLEDFDTSQLEAELAKRGNSLAQRITQLETELQEANRINNEMKQLFGKTSEQLEEAIKEVHKTNPTYAPKYT